MATSDNIWQKYRYTGHPTLQPRPGEKDQFGRPIYGYLPDKNLVDAVNLAIYLNRPLLLKGEPGCGKTRLAQAVAYELHLPYEAWHIKSTSRARDGLYTYDTVGRLRDAQLASKDRLKDIPGMESYIRWNALGRAFLRTMPSVVLIDEIDKADIDFPNDLLLELDEQRFLVEEVGREVIAREDARPIVIITSNDEKDLPDAFLRRCLFHYVNFPDETRLKEIINLHCPGVARAIVKAAVERFLELRERMKEDKERGKMISTSELIDWFRVLNLDTTLTSEKETLARLATNQPLLHASILLKSQEDQHYREPPSSRKTK